MSRHRNMKNLIAEDDYYDYDDDYYDDYDDGYDDYGGNYSYSYGGSSQSKNKNNATSNKSQQQQKQTKQNNNNKQKNQSQTQPSNNKQKQQAAASAGVTKPPPGWGKPSGGTPTTAAASKPASASASAGISKPPAGWGKPSTASPTPAAASSSPGVSKPPPGWGKPSTSAAPTTTASISATKQQQTKPKDSAASGSQQQKTQSPPTKKVPPILLQKKQSGGGQENQLSMVVIGHVDAGKSTMMGQMLYQTGQVTKRQATKVSASGAAAGGGGNKDDSSSNNIQWAWLLDEDEGERTRGVTMQIATKTIATPNHPRIVLLDAPGHADFVPTMITGAANADAGLLVVDASAESAFEAAFHRGGQTKEHILLARGLGVSQLIVCVNKLDVRDWSQEVYQDIQNRLLPFLTEHANFVKKRIRFVPTSGLTGANVKDAKSIPEGLKSWYKGPTLFDAIDSFQPVKQTSLDQPLRMILSDVYAEGKGVSARGRVIQGFLEAGERVVVLPIADEATVSSIDHLHALDDPLRHKYAVVGETVDLTITGIDSVRVATGSILSRTDIAARPPITKKCRAKIVVMDDLTIPIIRGAQVLFHIHSLDVPAVLTKLISSTKRGNNTTKNKPRAITSASSAVVEITLTNPICMESFSKCRALGRFVLRRSGDTIAVGIIEEVL